MWSFSYVFHWIVWFSFFPFALFDFYIVSLSFLNVLQKQKHQNIVNGAFLYMQKDSKLQSSWKIQHSHVILNLPFLAH